MKALLLSAAALIAAPLAAQTVAITGGTVAIGDGSDPIPGGTVVMRDGRIVAAGRVAAPAGATIVDASGKWVTAGLTAGIVGLGLADAGGIEESNDGSARQSPFNAAIDVATAINPANVALGNERAGGVTRAIVAGGAAGSIFAGQGAIIDLGVDADPITRARAFQYVELGEQGARLAGGSRPAAWVALHDALEQAADYRRSPAGFGGRSRDDLVKRADAKALLPVLDGAMPLVVHVERASDILQVLKLPQRYPKLRLVIAGAAEGWLVARELAAARVPVLAAALADLPASFEQVAATESNVGRMMRAGVTVAVTPDGNGGEHNLTQFAGNLVAIGKVPGSAGLSWGEAFAAITAKPAEVMGAGGEIGSLRAGRRADVVVWDRDPLELGAAPDAVFIDGVRQPIDSRQRQLRNRYLNVTEGALPKAYDR